MTCLCASWSFSVSEDSISDHKGGGVIAAASWVGTSFYGPFATFMTRISSLLPLRTPKRWAYPSHRSWLMLFEAVTFWLYPRLSIVYSLLSWISLSMCTYWPALLILQIPGVWHSQCPSQLWVSASSEPLGSSAPHIQGLFFALATESITQDTYMYHRLYWKSCSNGVVLCHSNKQTKLYINTILMFYNRFWEFLPCFLLPQIWASAKLIAISFPSSLTLSEGKSSLILFRLKNKNKTRSSSFYTSCE